MTSLLQAWDCLVSRDLRFSQQRHQKIAALWAVMSFIVAEVYCRFTGSDCLRHQSILYL